MASTLFPVSPLPDTILLPFLFPTLVRISPLCATPPLSYHSISPSPCHCDFSSTHHSTASSFQYLQGTATSVKIYKQLLPRPQPCLRRFCSPFSAYSSSSLHLHLQLPRKSDRFRLPVFFLFAPEQIMSGIFLFMYLFDLLSVFYNLQYSF